VSLEELRSFLTSVLVRAPRSRGLLDSLRSVFVREPPPSGIEPLRARRD